MIGMGGLYITVADLVVLSGRDCVARMWNPRRGGPTAIDIQMGPGEGRSTPHPIPADSRLQKDRSDTSECRMLYATVQCCLSLLVLAFN